jgi:hypothetical protein
MATKPTIKHAAGVMLPSGHKEYRSFIIHGTGLSQVTAAQLNSNTNTSAHPYELTPRPVKDPQGNVKDNVLIIWIRALDLPDAISVSPTWTSFTTAGDSDTVTYYVQTSTDASLDQNVTVVYNDDPPPTTMPITKKKK